MMPYWERRVDGRRFGGWVTFVFSVILVGLCLLKLSRPGSTDWDYIPLCLYALAALASGYHLYRTRGRRAP